MNQPDSAPAVGRTAETSDGPAAKMGLSEGQLVQELGFDEDIDFDFRDALEDELGTELLTEEDDVLLATKNGKAIRFMSTDVREFQSRSSTGVRSTISIRMACGQCRETSTDLTVARDLIRSRMASTSTVASGPPVRASAASRTCLSVSCSLPTTSTLSARSQAEK